MKTLFGLVVAINRVGIAATILLSVVMENMSGIQDTSSIFVAWAIAFVVTLIIEIPVFYIIAKKGSLSGENPPAIRVLVAAAVGTCATHPILWFVWTNVVSDYPLYIISGELLIAVVESITFYSIVKTVKFSSAVAASFLANGASFGVGILLS